LFGERWLDLSLKQHYPPSCLYRASMTIKTLYYPTDTINIIIKYLKHSKLLQHVSDHNGFIIRELYTVLG